MKLLEMDYTFGVSNVPDATFKITLRVNGNDTTIEDGALAHVAGAFHKLQPTIRRELNRANRPTLSGDQEGAEHDD